MPGLHTRDIAYISRTIGTYARPGGRASSFRASRSPAPSGGASPRRGAGPGRRPCSRACRRTSPLARSTATTTAPSSSCTCRTLRTSWNSSRVSIRPVPSSRLGAGATVQSRALLVESPAVTTIVMPRLSRTSVVRVPLSARCPGESQPITSNMNTTVAIFAYPSTQPTVPASSKHLQGARGAMQRPGLPAEANLLAPESRKARIAIHTASSIRRDGPESSSIRAPGSPPV